MKYTKTYTKEYEGYATKKNFLKFGKMFKSHNLGITTCHRCGEEFEEGQSMGIVFMKKNGNKFLCHNCIDP